MVPSPAAIYKICRDVSKTISVTPACKIKVLGLEAGVNITVGLPVIRTSVDHGTAFDIAGTGVADERSLIEALRQAAALAPNRL